MSEMIPDAVNGRLEALEGPPLRLVELPTADGGLELLIYDESGQVLDTSYVPPGLVGRDEGVEPPVQVPRQRQA
jgi:hypothetical protein